MAVCRKRSTYSAPEFLSNSYLTGTPPYGISMKAWISFGGLRPDVTLLRSMIFSAYTFQRSNAQVDRLRGKAKAHLYVEIRGRQNAKLPRVMTQGAVDRYGIRPIWRYICAVSGLRWYKW